jgi:hypothetical protein
MVAAYIRLQLSPTMVKAGVMQASNMSECIINITLAGVKCKLSGL